MELGNRVYEGRSPETLRAKRFKSETERERGRSEAVKPTEEVKG